MKRLISMRLDDELVKAIDGYQTELCNRSELIETLLRHVLESPDFVQSFQQNIIAAKKAKIETKEELTQVC